MHPVIEIMLFVLDALSIILIVYYAVVLRRIVGTERSLPTAQTGLDLPEPQGGWPSLCVVVPAHNEQDVIADLARSLLDQDYPNLRIVFALDRCTDDTRRILEDTLTDDSGALDSRAEIVVIDTCPDDWSGKTHAAHQGVTRSRGAQDARLLLFTDADTIFHPSLCRATVALLHHRDIGLLSLLSQLTSRHWYERLVQPAAGFELIREYPLDIVNSPRRPRAFANGQFMLFRRELYDAVGGHTLVKDYLLEDIAFVREINRRRNTLEGATWGVFMSAGLLRCRMYRSWDAFKRGWKRIYTESSGRRPGHLRKWSIRHRLAGTLLPLTALTGIIVAATALWLGMDPVLPLVSIALCAAGLVLYFAAMTHVYRSQGIHPLWVLTYPLGAWLAANIQSRAGVDLRKGRTTNWAGRRYHRKIRP